MAALEKREAEQRQGKASQPAIHIHDSNVANLNVGSQVGAIAAQTTGHKETAMPNDYEDRITVLAMSFLDKLENSDIDSLTTRLGGCRRR
jgi:hypothetical protein